MFQAKTAAADDQMYESAHIRWFDTSDKPATQYCEFVTIAIFTGSMEYYSYGTGAYRSESDTSMEPGSTGQDEVPTIFAIH